jgi:hypothetical protein
MRIDDEIIAINDIHVNTLKYEDIMKLLIITDEPVKFDIRHVNKQENNNKEEKQEKEISSNIIKINENKIEIGKETEIEIKNTNTNNNYNLGISIIGGINTSLKGIFIHDIHINEAIYNDGRLKIGDQLIKINDVDLINKTYDEALNILRNEMLNNNNKGFTKLKILRHFNDHSNNNNNLDINNFKSIDDDNDDNDYDDDDEDNIYKNKYDIRKIELTKKYGNGLGLSIVGKKDGKGGAYISHIIKGGLADKNGELMIGDYILSVNNKKLINSTYDDIVFYLKTLTPGKLTIKIARIKSNTSINQLTSSNSLNDYQSKLKNKSKSITLNTNTNNDLNNNNNNDNKENRNKFNRKSLLNCSLPNILRLKRQKSLPNMNK